MAVSYIDIDNASFELHVTLTPEDYAKLYKKSLNNFAKSVAIKGFRKGFAPIGMIQKLQGNAILKDTLLNLAFDQTIVYLEKNEYDHFIAGEMVLTSENEINFNQTDNVYEFTAPYIKHVPFDFEQFKQETAGLFKSYTPSISEEDINNEIQRYLLQRGEVQEIGEEEEVEENDVVRISYDVYDENGNILAAYSAETSVMPKMIKDEEERNAILGKKLNQTGKINLPKAFEESDKIKLARLALGINLEEDSAELMPDEYTFTITKIKRRLPLQLTVEVMNEAFPNHDIETEEDFRRSLENYMLRDAMYLSSQKLFDQIYTYLGNYNHQFPEHILEQNYQRNAQEDKNAKPWEEVREQEIKILKRYSIGNTILDRVGLEITEEELHDYTKTFLQQMLSRYGYDQSLAIDDEMAKNYLKNNPDFTRRAYPDIIITKAINYLIDNVVETEKVDITLEELQKM